MNIFLVGAVGDTITDAVAEIAKGMRYPVLVLALAALAAVAYEFGRLAVEWFQRTQATTERFDTIARSAMAQARAGDTASSQAVLRGYAYGEHLHRALVSTLFATSPIDAQRAVVDYDLFVSKRLDKVRLLVRSGPALGLMGTLIPLAPALAALGKGDAKVLANELQTAFAITVVGVLVGLAAFTIALLRERFYTRDLVDLEYLRELRGDAVGVAQVTQPVGATPVHMTPGTTEMPSSSPSAGGEAGASATPSESVTEAVQPVAPVVAAQPAPVAPAAVPPAPVGGAPGVPPAPPKAKRKVGVKRKAKPEPTVFPPPPPPPTNPAPVPPAPVDVPPPPADKSPSIDDGSDSAPDVPNGDADAG